MTYMFHIAHSLITTENCKTGCKRSTEITTSFTANTINEINEQSKHSVTQGRAS